MASKQPGMKKVETPGSGVTTTKPPTQGSSRKAFKRSMHQQDTMRPRSKPGNNAQEVPAGQTQALHAADQKILADDSAVSTHRASQQFKAIQKGIQESVERADIKLLEYDLIEQEKAEQLAMELGDIEKNTDSQLMLTSDDLEDMIPAASKAALFQVAESHQEIMMNLLKMYRDIDPASVGEPAEAGPVDDFMEQFKDAQDLVRDVNEHREIIQNKVDSARTKLQVHQEEARAAAAREEEEMGLDSDALGGSLTMARGLDRMTATGGGEASKVAGLKDHIKLLEGRVSDLQAEITEERERYEDMEEIKDELVESLKVELKRSKEQIEMVMGATAHELADSAAAVEDTRLHIAYLTVQLRNARELADARSFDVNKWVKKEDMEAVVKENNSLKIQVTKLIDRVTAEQRNTDEVHNYAKKCLHAKEMADAAHATWEMKLRETLKARDQDLVNLNFETRLLHHRADKLAKEVDETKTRIEKEKKEAIDKAMTAMEEQRSAFNTVLREKDTAIGQLKSENHTLQDSLAAVKKNYEDHLAAEKKAGEDRLARQVHTGMLTDPVKMGMLTEPVMGGNADTVGAGGAGGVSGLGISSNNISADCASQTSLVQGVMWKVLRRKFALEAIGALDRQARKLTDLDQNLEAMEVGMRTKLSESGKVINTLAESVAGGFQTCTENMQRLNEVLSALEAFSEKEMSAMKKRSQLKLAVKRSLTEMQDEMRHLLDADLREKLQNERHSIPDVDDDLQVFQNVAEQLQTVRAKVDEFQHRSVGVEDKLVSLEAELKTLLDGEVLQSIIACRMDVQHELTISQCFDLTHHRKCLAAITAGDFADSLPLSPGESILSNPHKEESQVLARIIKEWNRQKSEWVSERFKLIQEANNLRKELQNSNLQILQGSSSLESSRPDTHALPRSGSLKAIADSATYERSLNRSAVESLQMEMEALTRVIMNWWQKDNTYDLVEIQSGDDLHVPPLWKTSMELLQAATLAYSRVDGAAAAQPLKHSNFVPESVHGRLTAVEGADEAIREFEGSEGEKLSIAEDEAENNNVQQEASRDTMIEFLYSNNTAMQVLVRDLKTNVLACPVAPQGPVPRPTDEAMPQFASCPGCLSKQANLDASLKMDENWLSEDTAANVSSNAEAIGDVNAKSSEVLGNAATDGWNDASEPKTDARDVKVKSDRAGNSAAEDHAKSPHKYLVDKLLARMAGFEDSKGGDGEESTPTETCLYGHTHAVREILAQYEQQSSAERVAAQTLQSMVRRVNGRKGLDAWGSLIDSQIQLRTELEELASRMQISHQDLQVNLSQYKDENKDLKTQLQKRVEDLQHQHELGATLQTQLESLKEEIEQTRAELTKASEHASSSQEKAVTIQPLTEEIVAEITARARAEYETEIKELNQTIEKLKAFNEYLERKGSIYSKVKDEVDDTNKFLGEMGAKTVAMAGDLVQAREASKKNEAYVQELLDGAISTSRAEQQAVEQQLSLVEAALQMTIDTNSISEVSVPAAQANLSLNGEPALRLETGEPCPVCQGKGVKTVVSSKKEFPIDPPRSTGRTVSSPRAQKKARAQLFSSRGKVPKLTGIGRSVILEEEDSDADAATSAARLLKLVDQDFAEVIASRDQLRSMFSEPTPRRFRSPRHQLRAQNPSKPEDPKSTPREGEAGIRVLKGTSFEPEKIASLPSLFPPLMSSVKTPRTQLTS